MRHSIKLIYAVSALAVYLALGPMHHRPHFSFGQVQLPQIYQASGEQFSTVQVGAMFCEIKNFQEIYLQNDPVCVAAFLRYYFDKVLYCVEIMGGKVNKFVGPSFFAVFPKSPGMSDTALCNALMSCVFALIAIEEDFAQRGIVDMELGIGVNFGAAAVGSVGDARFCEEAYVGDAINVASRLQKQCFSLGKNVLVSQKVFKNLDQKYKTVLTHLSFHGLKGRAKKVCCYGYGSLKDDKVMCPASITDHKIHTELFINLLPPSFKYELSRIVVQKYVIICCDIRNFTTYCERDSGTPDAILHFLSIYYRGVIQIVSKYRGEIYKFLGDGVLIVFPVCGTGELVNVCDMALKCSCELVELARRFDVENGVGVDIDDLVLVTVGLDISNRWARPCNDIFLGASLKRVFDLESINKNPYIHSFSKKHIVVSDVFYNSMSEDSRSYFECANSYVFNKKTQIWFYTSDGTPSLPPLAAARRHSVIDIISKAFLDRRRISAMQCNL